MEGWVSQSTSTKTSAGWFPSLQTGAGFFPECRNSAILLPSKHTDTEESAGHSDVDVVHCSTRHSCLPGRNTGSSPGAREFALRLQEKTCLQPFSRFMWRSVSMCCRRNALQLLVSLHFKQPPLRLSRRLNLNCSDGEKLHCILRSRLVTACSVVCRSVCATCVCGHQVLLLFATSGKLSCGSTTNFSAKLPETSVLFGIWPLLHNSAVN